LASIQLKVKFNNSKKEGKNTFIKTAIKIKTKKPFNSLAITVPSTKRSEAEPLQKKESKKNLLS
jgi:hypothetical protein